MSNHHEFEFASRAVYKALKRMSNDYSLQHAGFNYWLSKHSQSALNAVDFSNDLQAHFDLSSRDKSSFMVALHAAMTLSLEALPAVPASMLAAEPGELSRATAEPEQAFSAPSSPQWLMVTSFLKESVAEVKKVSSTAFVDFHEILKEEQGDLDQSQWAIISAWVDSGFTKLAIAADISSAECVVFTHYIYLIMCEAVGPMKADKAVQLIVMRLNKLAESKGVEPINIL